MISPTVYLILIVLSTAVAITSIVLIVVFLRKSKTKPQTRGGGLTLRGPPTMLSAGTADEIFVQEGGWAGTILRSQLPFEVQQQLDTHTLNAQSLLRDQLPPALQKELDVQTSNLQQPLHPDNGIWPPQYDLRDEYPGRISGPSNQENCGSCWAFSVCGALSDRIRIYAPNHLNVMIPWTYQDGHTDMILDRLNAHFLAACDFCNLSQHDRQIVNVLLDSQVCNLECDGGILEYAYIYANQNGLVGDLCNDTGNLYQCHSLSDINSIVPVQKPGAPCHVFRFGLPFDVSLYPNSVLEVDQDGSKRHENERHIQREIYLYGSVSASYMLYQSFYDFFRANPTGVYSQRDKKVTEPAIGGHAVVLTGWGIDPASGTKYWIVRNSWGLRWGDQGYFKMERGVNFCSLEADVWSSFVNLPDLQQTTGYL